MGSTIALLYDVGGFLFMAGICLYLAYAKRTKPHVLARLPAFVRSRNFSIPAAVFFLSLAVVMGIIRKDLYANPAPPASTVAAFGSNAVWTTISTAGDGITLAIDSKNIIKSGTQVEYSEQLSFATPKPMPEPVHLVAKMNSRQRVDCVEHTRIMLDFLITRPDGSQLFQNNSAPPQKMPISTDRTQPEFIASSYACAQQLSTAK